MKINRIIYWTSTALIALMMAFSAYSYFMNPDVKQGFQHLGFPDYFRIELGAAKFIGTVLLLAPVANRVKEWAYAGFAITFLSAFIAHTASGDPVSNRIMPLVALAMLVTSYISYYRKASTATPPAPVRTAIV